VTDTLQPPAETVREPGCADVFRRLGGDPTGTATQMRSWLLIEHDGPWPADVLTRVLKAALRPERRAELATLQGEAGLRPLLVRRVRRPRRPGVDRPVTVLAGGGLPGNRWLEEITLPRLTDLGDLDLEAIAAGRGGLGRPVDGPMFLVCTHGRKDVCCASFGRPVARALDAAHPGRVWETTHVGGDRWAANLLTVPDGLLHGQLDPATADLVVRAALRGEVHPGLLRGRTSASPWAQAAEVAVRVKTGLRGLDDVLAVSERRHGSPGEPPLGCTVAVSAGAELWEVRLQRRPTGACAESRCDPLLKPAEWVVERLDLTG